jgi:hypothetical protein
MSHNGNRLQSFASLPLKSNVRKNMVARDRIPSDPTISKHVVHWSSIAEPSGTRHSGQINEDMHQADLCHGVRRILGPNPLYSKLGLQPPHYRPSPAASYTSRSRAGDQDPQHRPFRRIAPKCMVEEERHCRRINQRTPPRPPRSTGSARAAPAALERRRHDLPPASSTLGPAATVGEACGSGGEDLHQGDEFLVAARVSTDQLGYTSYSQESAIRYNSLYMEII